MVCRSGLSRDPLQIATKVAHKNLNNSLFLRSFSPYFSPGGVEYW